MALTHPERVIGIAYGRHAQDVITAYRAAGRPFIYWKATATGGAWNVVDADGSSDIAVSPAVTDRENSNQARANASVQFTDDGMLIV